MDKGGGGIPPKEAEGRRSEDSQERVVPWMPVEERSGASGEAGHQKCVTRLNLEK